MTSTEIFERSVGRDVKSRIVGGVLANETEGLFKWQFGGGECPRGCKREKEPGGGRGWCVKDEAEERNSRKTRADREL